jgi:hypothetical protein
MAYTRAVGVMVLDKMSRTNAELGGLEQRLDRVEDVCATNDDIQNVEMTLGAEIHKV